MSEAAVERPVLVTGAAGGMGRAVMEALAGAGIDVIGLDVDAERGTLAAAEVGASFVPFDLSTLPVAADQLRERIEERTEELSGIVNAAGISSGEHFPDVSGDHWEAVLRTNLTSPFFVVQSLVDLLVRPGASIVNITSAEATGVYSTSDRSTPAYAAAKAGLKLTTECLAMDLGSEGIRVNAIAPGLITTPMTEALRTRVGSQLDGLIPVGRWGTPDEVAAVALFLLSAPSAYVSGASIAVDGGVTLGFTGRTNGLIPLPLRG